MGGEIYLKDKEKQIQRDLEIMKMLTSGIATKDYLAHVCFRDESGKQVSRQVVERRLATLEKNGYIARRRYGSMNTEKSHDIYTLAERGINEVCKVFSYEKDFIRHYFPTVDKLVHELQLSSIMRVIKNQAEEGKFKIVEMFDDVVMKRRAGSSKSFYYPDLVIMMETNLGRKCVFYLELDGASKSAFYWKRKVIGWEWPTLVLSFTTARLEMMKQYVTESGRTKETGFALTSEFEKKGLNTEWYWLPQKVRGRIDLL